MAISATFPTDLDILFDFAGSTVPGVNPWSARGLRGTLTAIDAARGNNLLARTVNGTLIDISAPQMRKYRLEVVGNDTAPPALDGLWVGMVVDVSAHVELAYLTAAGSPEHAYVAGSQHIEGDYTYYRPQFKMLVVEWQIEREEWEQNVAWSLALEEI